MVKNPDNTPNGVHPRGLLLQYLEDLLPREERDALKQHVHGCSECSSELGELESMITRLRNNKTVFCPESWELHEWLQTGNDPEGRIQSHAEKCPHCAEELADFRKFSERVEVPDRVQAAFRQRFGKPFRIEPEPLRTGKLVVLSEWLASRFRHPVLAAGALAAAILVGVLIYPQGGIEPMYGLSSVTWEQTEGRVPKGALLDETKPRAAILLIFRGFKRPVPQEKIDELYEWLIPTRQTEDKFEFISPAEVKASLSKSTVPPNDRNALLGLLARDLDVSRALILTIKARDGKFEIEGELVDPASGRTIRKQIGKFSSEAELMSTIGDWSSLMY